MERAMPSGRDAMAASGDTAGVRREFPDDGEAVAIARLS
jgi:hypothetical protein